MQVTNYGTLTIPEARGSTGATSHEEIDRLLQDLAAKKNIWLTISAGERAKMLDRMIEDLLKVAPRWVEAAIQAKGLQAGTTAGAEEWIAGAMITMRSLRLLANSLREVVANGSPTIPGPVITRPDGQVVASIFPQNLYDKILYGGISAEIWMQPGVTAETLSQTQAVAYKKKATQGKIALVLGGGNVASIGPLDALYKLFVEDQVVILKMNPVNDYLGPYFAEFMQTISGYCKIVYGGAAEGEYLCQHPLVDEIHITGSDKTHDAIVFGGGVEGAKRKAERQPRLTKRITSELGNVSPVIVVPGPWSQGDLDFQGTNLASMLTNNAGFNCNATRVIITHASWSQRGALLEATRKVLARVAPRQPYYPGAEDRWERFVQDHPQAEKFGQREPGKLPWTIIAGLDPSNTEEVCFSTEAFCSIFGETPLEAADPIRYLEKAVEFCNQRLWGTLNACILVHPTSMKDPAMAAAVEKAIADLRYGAVAVNLWPAIAYALGSPTWGAFPGHDSYDIQSGVGVVHNTLLFDKAQKTVIRAPFKIFPTPLWFATNKRAWQLAPKLLAFEAHPSVDKLPGLLWEAMRG
jgi:acyl-CoA reductase-like NAD-dependent aldehyde dehydrogenase